MDRCRKRRCCKRCDADCLACCWEPCDFSVVCDPDMIARTIKLMTQPTVWTYYVLAAFYVFGFAADSQQYRHVALYSALQMLPTLYLLTTLICSTYLCQTGDNYVWYVVIAILVSAVADGFLVYEPDYFVYVVFLYTVVLISLIAGLLTKFNGASYSWGIVVVMALLLWCISKLVEGYLSVLVVYCYGFFMTGFVLLALARYERQRTGPAYLGAAGAVLLVFAHSLYTLGEFAPQFVCVISPELVQMIGYMAMLCIAQSSHFG